jgi:hypothetical protein
VNINLFIFTLSRGVRESKSMVQEEKKVNVFCKYFEPVLKMVPDIQAPRVQLKPQSGVLSLYQMH